MGYCQNRHKPRNGHRPRNGLEQEHRQNWDWDWENPYISETLDGAVFKLLRHLHDMLLMIHTKFCGKI